MAKRPRKCFACQGRGRSMFNIPKIRIGIIHTCIEHRQEALAVVCSICGGTGRLRG